MFKKLYTGLFIVAAVSVASVIISRMFESEEEPEGDVDDLEDEEDKEL